MISKKIISVGITIFVIFTGGYFVYQNFFRTPVAPNIPQERLLGEVKESNDIYANEDEQKENNSENESGDLVVEPNDSENDNRMRRASAEEKVEPAPEKPDQIIYNKNTGNYERTIFESIGEHEIVKYGNYDFDFIEIIDSEYDESVVGGNFLILPRKRFEITLPKGANINNVIAVVNNSVELGKLNIPISTNAPEMPGAEQYTEAPNSIGLFDEMYSYGTYDTQDNLVLLVDLFPVSYDTVTDETILYKDIEIKVEYETDIKGVLLQASPRKQYYKSGEMIDVFVSLVNVIDETNDFEVTVDLKGFLDKVVQTKTTIVTVDSAEFAQTNIQFEVPKVNVDMGGFWFLTSVSDGKNVIGTSREHINVN